MIDEKDVTPGFYWVIIDWPEENPTLVQVDRPNYPLKYEPSGFNIWVIGSEMQVSFKRIIRWLTRIEPPILEDGHDQLA